jgi:hypothetical protein
MKRKFIIEDAGEGFEFYELLEGKEIVGLVIEGEFDLEEEDLGTYVRVEFIGGSYSSSLYCYEDPGLDLKIGDLVDVPTQYEEHNVAQVKALGRGSWIRSCLPVTARYERIEGTIPF